MEYFFILIARDQNEDKKHEEDFQQINTKIIRKRDERRMKIITIAVQLRREEFAGDAGDR